MFSWCRGRGVAPVGRVRLLADDATYAIPSVMCTETATLMLVDVLDGLLEALDLVQAFDDAVGHA